MDTPKYHADFDRAGFQPDRSTWVVNDAKRDDKGFAAAPELLAALVIAENRLKTYATWAQVEIMSSRGNDLMRNIKIGCIDDANDCRAAIANAEGGK